MSKAKVKPKLQPSFESGIVVDHKCLVVDKNGISWWIDPTLETITIATIEEQVDD